MHACLCVSVHMHMRMGMNVTNKINRHNYIDRHMKKASAYSFYNEDKMPPYTPIYTQSCFMSTDTVQTIRGGEPRMATLLSHSTQALNFSKFSVALHPQKLDRPLGTQDGHLYFHTAPSPRAPLGPTHYPNSTFISCRNPKHLRWNCILHSIFI